MDARVKAERQAERKKKKKEHRAKVGYRFYHLIFLLFLFFLGVLTFLFVSLFFHSSILPFFHFSVLYPCCVFVLPLLLLLQVEARQRVRQLEKVAIMRYGNGLSHHVPVTAVLDTYKWKKRKERKNRKSTESEDHHEDEHADEHADEYADEHENENENTAAPGEVTSIDTTTEAEAETKGGEEAQKQADDPPP